MCEGPLDALALVHLERLGSANLHGGAVHGAPGVSRFQLAACPGRGPVTVWRDRDTNGQGQRAAAQLAGQLRRTGRRVTIHGAPWDGADLVGDKQRVRWPAVPRQRPRRGRLPVIRVRYVPAHV